MKIKKNIKNIMGVAITVSALISGAAGATTFTGSVAWLSTNNDGYTFVNVLTPTGNAVAYYTGTNSAIASIIDNAKRHNQDITVVTSEGGWDIQQIN